MEEGLAAMVSSGSKPSMMYGNGESQNTRHYYGGTMSTKSKKKLKTSKGK